MLQSKIIAFYLPQFHSIPENDKWWGKDFTEWTNVKKATPLFKSHNQPRMPLDDNYYNLLNPETFTWQVDLAQKYNIYGFCFYHYWFNGKLLLEKPLENFLERKDLNLHFCLSWANEPWTRTWDGGENNILMPQIYGGKEDINKHFRYLLSYFKDNRYIKVNNKPMFLIYRARDITYFDEMIEIWNTNAKNEGFDGIYFVETIRKIKETKVSMRTNAIVYFEPWCIAHVRTFWGRLVRKIQIFLFHGRRLSYKNIWKDVVKRENLNENVFGGAFLDWDNSLRKKKNYLLLKNVQRNTFSKYFYKQYLKACNNDSPYIFVNAWNEWGESTYLEPDTKNRFFFLETIKDIQRSVFDLYKEKI